MLKTSLSPSGASSSSRVTTYISTEEMHVALTQFTIIQDCYTLLSSIENINDNDAEKLKNIVAIFHTQLAFIIAVISQKIKDLVNEKTRPLLNIHGTLRNTIYTALGELNRELARLSEEKNPAKLFKAFTGIINKFILAIEVEAARLPKLDDDTRNNINAGIEDLKFSLSSENIIVAFSKEESDQLNRNYEKVIELITDTSISDVKKIFFPLIESLKCNLKPASNTFTQDEINFLTEITTAEFIKNPPSNFISSLITNLLYRLSNVQSIVLTNNLDLVEAYLGLEQDKTPFLNSVQMLCRVNTTALSRSYQAWNYIAAGINVLNKILDEQVKAKKTKVCESARSKLTESFQLSMRIVMPRIALRDAIEKYQCQLLTSDFSSDDEVLSKRMSDVFAELNKSIGFLEQLTRVLNAFKSAYEFIEKIDSVLVSNKNIPANIQKCLREIKKYLYDITGSERYADPANFEAIINKINEVLVKNNINFEDLCKTPEKNRTDSHKLIIELLQRYQGYWQVVEPAKAALLERKQIVLKWRSQKLELTSEKNALALVGLNETQLERIPDTSIRQKLIRSKFLLAQLEFSYLCRESKNADIENEILDELQNAYDYAVQKYSAENKNVSISTGLTELESIATSADFIRLGDKQDGVEPGFETALVADTVECLERKFPDLTERIEYFRQFKGNYYAIYQALKDEAPKYLIKFNYVLDSRERAAPSADDLSKTRRVQNAQNKSAIWGYLYLSGYKVLRTDSTTNKNVQAVIEVLTNDLARASGMTVQHQTLVLDNYENGALKIMPKGQWLAGARTLAPLAGGNTETNHYCVRKTLWRPEGIAYTVDHSIKGLSWYFATFVVNADWDSIGTRGQNKLVVNNEFVGIDFGHAFENVSPLVELLTSDFHLPISKTGPYRNYSIFHDYTKRELMCGLLIQAKLAGVIIDPNIIAQYGIEFQDKYNSIEPHALEKVFDDYLQIFQSYLESAAESDKNDFRAIIDKINEVRKVALTSLHKLVKRFEGHLALPPVVHDILENLNKISAGASNTTLRSLDGKVMLSHLRYIDESSVVEWQVVKKGEEEYHFSAIFSDNTKAQAAFNNLTQFATLQTNIVRDNVIAFSCKSSTLDNLAFKFNEDSIVTVFHTNDAKIRSILNAEKQFRIDIDRFNSLKLGVHFNLHFESSHYRLALKNVDEANVHVLNLLQSHFFENDGRDYYRFSPAEIAYKHQSFKRLLESIQKLNQIESAIEKLKHKYNLITKLTINSLENCIFEYANEKTQSSFESLLEKVESIDNEKQKLMEDVGGLCKEINRTYNINLSVEYDHQNNRFKVTNLAENMQCFAGRDLTEACQGLTNIKNCLDTQAVCLGKIADINAQYYCNVTVLFDWKTREFTIGNLPENTRIHTHQFKVDNFESVMALLEAQLDLLNIETKINAKIDELNQKYHAEVKVLFDRAKQTAKLSNLPVLYNNEINITYENWQNEIDEIQSSIDSESAAKELIVQINQEFKLNLQLVADQDGKQYEITRPTYIRDFVKSQGKQNIDVIMNLLYQKMVALKSRIEEIILTTKQTLINDYGISVASEIYWNKSEIMFLVDIFTVKISDFLAPKDGVHTLLKSILEKYLKSEIEQLQIQLSAKQAKSTTVGFMWQSARGFVLSEVNSLNFLPALDTWLQSSEPFNEGTLAGLRTAINDRLTHIQTLVATEPERQAEIDLLTKLTKIISYLTSNVSLVEGLGK